jgi:hypothetical protein
MAKFVVGSLKLGIRDPNRNTVSLAHQSIVDVLAEVLAKIIGRGTERTNPHLPPHSFVDTLHGVPQSAIACCARLKVPALLAWREGGFFRRDGAGD